MKFSLLLLSLLAVSITAADLEESKEAWAEVSSPLPRVGLDDVMSAWHTPVHPAEVHEEALISTLWERTRRYAQASSLMGSFMYRFVAYLGLTLIVCILHNVFGWTLWYPIPFTTAVQFVVGFLLVFRTNTAYHRFDEGRKIWADLMNATRCFHRMCKADIRADPDIHIKADALLVDLMYSIKDFLRFESLPGNRVKENSRGKFVNPPHGFDGRPCRLHEHEERPHRILLQLADFVQDQREHNTLGMMQLSYLNRQLTDMSKGFSNAQRILRTPIPTAYSIHVRQIVALYCIAFPFSIVAENRWSTLPLSFLVFYVILGVQAIAQEIENPFGYNYGDLPLQHFCETMALECEIERPRDE